MRRFIMTLMACLMAASVNAKENDMVQAKGTFTVAMQPTSGEQDRTSRMSIDKQFSGDLTGSSSGEMMMDAVDDNGVRVYVAIEKVTGSLEGREGSFLLAHRGTMSPDDQELSVIIVPQSGLQELRGIEGTLAIDIIDGVHHYVLDYRLPKD